MGETKEKESRERFELIEKWLSNPKSKLSVAYMCKCAGVSRSGFYSYLSSKRNPASKLNQREIQDRKDFELILAAYKHRGYDKGRRGIRMRLLHMGIKMNEKKISRLMKKYNLKCPIRKANPYRRMVKALRTSNVADNLLKRNFEAYGPRTVLLTDITYLFYNQRQSKAYLSVVKDAFTKEILAYAISDSLEMDFVLETVNKLIAQHGKELKTNVLLHSDQGFHYTNFQFIDLLKNKNIRQSMSRRGNCWDNAPQESFFGHMKDEITLSECSNYDDLKQRIDDYMDYYNNERYQYRLAKLSPKEFYNYCISGVYPLDCSIPQSAINIENLQSVS